MKESLDFERFEKEVKTFALIKKKFDRLLKEFYSEEVYKGSYVDRSTLDKVVQKSKQDENNRLRAQAQQHLVNYRVIEYLACLQVQMDNLHQFLKLMVKQLDKDTPKIKKLLPKAIDRRKNNQRRSSETTRRKVYDLGYQGSERRSTARRKGGRRAS